MIGWVLRRALRLLVLLVSLPRLALGAVVDALSRRDALVLRFTREVPDHHAGWRRFFAAQPVLSLEDGLEAIAHARVKLVLVLLDRAELAVTQAEELVAALDAARARGVRSIVWIDGTTAPCLLASCAADRALATPEATLEFQGLRVRSVFLAELFELVGIVPELDREGAYKTMADMFDHRRMSPEHREMMTDLGGDLHDQFVSALVTGRKLDRARVTAALDDAPVSHRAAVAQRLLDGLAYRDEVEERGRELLGLDRDLRTIDAARAVRARRRREQVRDAFLDRPVIAVLPLVGAIVPGETGRGLPAHAAVDLLDELREASAVRAVVLRIDSPGGSATASDDLWQAVKRLDREKPVIASLGRVAASGGYYAAVGARRIIAHASTLTGSIGIVAGKLCLAPLLERAGVRIEGPAFGARAGMYDPDRPFTDDERRAARRELERFYRVFLERVAEGRELSMFEVEKVAQGRVYTGRRALELGLVDDVGTFGTALAAAREEARITGPHRLARVQLSRGWTTSLTSEHARLAWALDLLALSRERALAWCPIELHGI